MRRIGVVGIDVSSILKTHLFPQEPASIVGAFRIFVSREYIRRLLISQRLCSSQCALYEVRKSVMTVPLSKCVHLSLLCKPTAIKQRRKRSLRKNVAFGEA